MLHLWFLRNAHYVTGKACDGGHLVVYNLQNGIKQLAGKYCGERFPWTVISQTNNVHMQLTGDSWLKGTHQITMQYSTIGKHPVAHI